ncbi:MAG: hypothetical protein LQ346_002820 [Caloplaca aetnensis]|nr:MAG: hypothetical protein LQ346_002820 [Caloplaca aetnensis]
MTTELKEEIRQTRQHQKKKRKEVQFKYGATNVLRQQVPNVATRSSVPDQKAIVIDSPSAADDPSQVIPIDCENPKESRFVDIPGSAN